MIEADTAYNKQHKGSMKLTTNDGSKAISIIANHVKDPYDKAPYDKAIGVYRWVDALHDFEPYFKKTLNPILRGQYGIGTINDTHEFRKEINKTEYAFTTTTASRNTLHKILNHEQIKLIDSEGSTTITYPNMTNKDTEFFTYNLPKLLGTYELNQLLEENPEGDLPTGPILEEYPEGDLLLDITGNKDDFFNKAPIIKKFLGIHDDTDTYLKDSANIPTTTFQKIFKPNTMDDIVYDYSFFSEILDPSSEQTEILDDTAVQLTLLYCMINTEPVYITIQKRKNEKEPWHYAFHLSKSDIPKIFHAENFGKTNSGAHPAPNIETAVYFIKNDIQQKKLSALLHDVRSIVSRMTNKSKEKLKYSLTKKEAQNRKNSGKFTEFYYTLLSNFQLDLKRTLTQDQAITVIIAFKTIGDQMYLYDSILLSEVDPAKPNRQPWMITGDTFLKDYGIYTKSTNIMCPTKYGKEAGSRKLTVYIKPQAKLTQDQINTQKKILEDKKAKLEAEKESREGDYTKYKQSVIALNSLYKNKFIDEGIYKITPFMEVIQEVKPVDAGRNVTHFYINNPDMKNIHMKNIHGITLILLYNAIVHVILTCQNLDDIKTRLNDTVENVDFNKIDDPKKQNDYLKDLKETLDSYTTNIEFIKAVSITDIPAFIKSVLRGVSKYVDGISDDIANPIKNIRGIFYNYSLNQSFDIINSDIISKLKGLHEPYASPQLLFPFKDFLRQQSTISKNLDSIITKQFGAGITPSKIEIINMLKEDIDELLSVAFRQYKTQYSYSKGLSIVLDLINTRQMGIDKREDPKVPYLDIKNYLNIKKFELLRNISASYETAIDFGYDNDIDSLAGQTYVVTYPPVTYPPITQSQIPPVTQSQINSLVPPNATPSNITKKKRELDEISDSNIFMPQQKFRIRTISAKGKKTKRNKKKQNKKKQTKTKRNKTKRNKKK